MSQKYSEWRSAERHLRKELAIAMRVAAECMRMLTDDQMKELRRRMDQGEGESDGGSSDDDGERVGAGTDARGSAG